MYRARLTILLFQMTAHCNTVHRLMRFLLLQDPYPDKSLKALSVLESMFQWLVAFGERRRRSGASQQKTAAQEAAPAAAAPAAPAAEQPGADAGAAEQFGCKQPLAEDHPPAVSTLVWSSPTA